MVKDANHDKVDMDIYRLLCQGGDILPAATPPLVR